MDGATIDYMPHGIKHWLNESSTRQVAEDKYKGRVPCDPQAFLDLLRDLYDNCTYIEIFSNGVEQMLIPNHGKYDRVWYLHGFIGNDEEKDHLTCEEIVHAVDIDNAIITVLF